MPGPARTTWTQPALFGEDFAQLELRIGSHIGEQSLHVSSTICDVNGTWLACVVLPRDFWASEARAKLHVLLDVQLDLLGEYVGPF